MKISRVQMIAELPSRLAMVLLALTFSLLTNAAHAVTIEGDTVDNFIAEARNTNEVIKLQTEKFAGIANQHTGIVIDKQRQAVVALFSPTTGNRIAPSPAVNWPSVWALQVHRKSDRELLSTSATEGNTVAYLFHNEGDRTIMTMAVSDIAIDEASASVSMTFALSPTSQRFVCRSEAAINDASYNLWEVTFPQVLIEADNSQAESRMLLPYRRGRWIGIGDSMARYKIQHPYPSASAHFQFVATYKKSGGNAFYMATEDEDVYAKTFHHTNEPRDVGVILGLSHWVDGRGGNIQKYALDYDIVLQTYEGTWWHACRLYRKWWVTTTWARRGLIRDRADIPDWLKKSPIMARMSTTRAHRTIENNVKGIEGLRKFLDNRPFTGIWYGPFDKADAGTGTGLDQAGHGHFLPLHEGLSDALKQLEKKDVFPHAYVQSHLYQFNINTPEANAERDLAQRMSVQDQDGKVKHYPYGEDLFEVCRSTKWWQDRVAEISKRAVEQGFHGIYLDSFGRGDDECFAHHHGHTIGGGKINTQGQRELAQRVRDAIRKVNPNAILSGEAPVEAYRDILDLNLYATNTIEGYLPCMRVIWGDYSLGHGRTMRPSTEKQDNLIHEIAALYLEGTLLGRFFCSDINHFFLEPKFEAEARFLKTIFNYTDVSLEHVRFGDYLEPLDLGDAVEEFIYIEGVLNRRATGMTVQHSVTHSYADNSVGVVMINCTDSAQPVTIKPQQLADRAGAASAKAIKLHRVDEHGKRTAVAVDDIRSIELQPHEIYYLVVTAQ